MTQKQIQYLPFHAINEFMLTEYRQQVINSVFHDIENLSGASRGKLNSLVKQQLQVPGFRNASQAPSGVKARYAVKAFEKSTEFAAQVLQCWSELHSELAQDVYAILQENSWEILPVDTNRTVLPGFIPSWPEGETYDLLDDKYAKRYPEKQVDTNDLRLMAVWLSGRLPLNDSSEEEK
ncbi:MAG: hypothetical protein ABFD14_04415 [Anaerolineaceae bacterium]